MPDQQTDHSSDQAIDQQTDHSTSQQIDQADPTRQRAEEILRALAGPAARLRDDQWQAIAALVRDRRRTLVVQRTGWGKSAVYFIATALLRGDGAGPTLIISPLLALMRNQVAAAERAGLHARTINSANLEEWSEIEAAVAAGEVDLLLVSPERLNNPSFRDNVLPALAASAGLVVVDEAHCISDWGHDFRPDYRRLRDLLRGLGRYVPVLATTATANNRVTYDVAEQLGDTGATPSDAGATPYANGTPVANAESAPALVLRGSLDRETLRLGVLTLPTSAHRLAWLADHLGELTGSGIIYTLTVAQADDVATFLRSRGYDVAAYSGRTDDTERRKAEDDLLHNRIKALVATSALGMGFDKPDLGFVVHLGAPQSPIAYYQQVGRAGRAVEHADVLLLPGQEDEDIWRYFAGLAFPPEQVVRRVLGVLSEADRPLSTPALEPQVELNRARLEMLLKVLDVDGAVRRVQGGWTATGQAWHYDTQRYARIAEARAREQQAMRDYVRGNECRMQFLRRQLDDPGAAPCGRCDRCAPPFYDAAVSDGALASARGEIRRPGVEISARTQWPTALAAVGVSLSGRLSADERAEPGRAIGRLSDIGWGALLREHVSDTAPDREVADELIRAAVAVLAQWDWAERPAVVASIESRRRPTLVRSVATKVASIGRLPYAGEVERLRTADGAGLRTNSAQRVRALHDAFRVPPQLSSALKAADGGPVLLVDDLVDSGWTMTVVARELRRSGARAVLPFALALAG